MFQTLPPELLHIILEYASIKCRNGKYINQIAKTDPRYDILKSIPPVQLDNIHANYYRSYKVQLPNNASICYFHGGLTMVIFNGVVQML